MPPFLGLCAGDPALMARLDPVLNDLARTLPGFELQELSADRQLAERAKLALPSILRALAGETINDSLEWAHLAERPSRESAPVNRDSYV